MSQTSSGICFDFVPREMEIVQNVGDSDELGISSEKMPRLHDDHQPHQVLLSVPESEIEKMTAEGDRGPVYFILDSENQKVQGIIDLSDQNIDESGAPEIVSENDINPAILESGNRSFVIENAKGAEVDIQTLQRNNSQINLEDNTQNESLDDSNFNEENLLANLAKQVALQQHYLSLSEFSPGADSNSDKPSHPMSEINNENQYPGNASPADVAMTTSYSILPSLLNEPPVSTATWFPVTLTPTSSSPPQINSAKTIYHPGSIVTNKSAKKQQVITSTPVSGNTQRILQPVQLDGSGRYVYTPHPKTGQFLYVSQIDTGSPKIYHVTPTESSSSTKTPATSSNQIQSTPNVRVDTNCKKLQLNSSGEETQSSPDFQPENTPSSSDDSSIDKDKMTFEFSLINGCEEGRETHNLKERKRRARIKDACDVMRKLVPGMSDKTDKATVFEFAARYIHYLKSFVGNKHDKDFLLKYSPY